MRTMSIGCLAGSSLLTRSPTLSLSRVSVVAAPLRPAITIGDVIGVCVAFLLIVGHLGLGLAAVSNGVGPVFSSSHKRPIEASNSLTEYFLDILNASAPAVARCPLLHQRLARQICSLPANWKRRARTQMMRSLRFRFCDSFLVFHAVSPNCSDIEELTEPACVQCFDRLEQHDLEAYAMFCQFEEALSRFDCRSEYSRHWTCPHCKEAYKNWVCANTLPFYHQKSLITTCSDYCHNVQNRCPYFLPELENQYAGEASFICPDIPVTATSSSALCHHPCQTSDMSNLYNETNICVRHVDRLSPTPSSSSSPFTSSTSLSVDSTVVNSDAHQVASNNSVSSGCVGDTLRQPMRHHVVVMLLVTCHCLWMVYTQQTLLSQTFYCVTGLT